MRTNSGQSGRLFVIHKGRAWRKYDFNEHLSGHAEWNRNKNTIFTNPSNPILSRVDSSDRPGQSRGFRILTEFISMTGRPQICDRQEISEMIVLFQDTKS